MGSNKRSSVSFSAFNDWNQCEKKYELKRLVKAPTVPSFSLIGGSAVHAVCDDYDLDDTGLDSNTFDFHQTFVDKFDELLEEEERKSGVPHDHWMIPGKKSKAWPNGRDRDWWTTEGPKMARSYALWREANPAWMLWQTPQKGESAIELDIKGVKIGEVPTLGRLDRIFVVDGQLVVVDIKTGSRTPQWLIQLGLYAMAVEKRFDIRPKYGCFFLAEKGVPKAPVDLSVYTEKYLEAILLKHRYEVNNSETFIPNVTDMCNSCEVKASCYAMGGTLSHLYDNLHPSNLEGVSEVGQEQ